MSNVAMDEVFNQHALYAVDASAVVNNPAFIVHRGKALPANVVINALTSMVARGTPPAPIVPSPVPAPPAPVVAPEVPVVEATEEQPPIVVPTAEALLPYEEKFPVYLDNLRRLGYYRNIQVNTNAYDHPMIEAFDEALEREEGLLNYKAITFALKGTADAGESLGNVPDVSGTYGSSAGGFGGEAYRGQPVTAYAVIIVGDWLPTGAEIDRINRGLRIAQAQGPFIVGYLGETAENGDPIHICILANGFITTLSRELPEVKAYSSRRKRERDEKHAELKALYRSNRAAGLTPKHEAWGTEVKPEDMKPAANDGVSKAEFDELKGMFATLMAKLGDS